MTKCQVKNTIGPYPIVCLEIKKNEFNGTLTNWIETHSESIQIELIQHMFSCHRCVEIYRQRFRDARESVSEISHTEIQALLEFDPVICAQVAEHRKDLVDWIYSIKKNEALFIDVFYHLGICDNCPATIEEMDQILLIVD